MKVQQIQKIKVMQVERGTGFPWVNTRLLTRRLVVRISAMASLYFL